MTADATFWNQVAEKYAAKPVADPVAFDRKIAITRARLDARSVVLDLGCGTGSLALRLADAAAHVHGLDLSREMIRIARDKAARERITNVTFHVGPFDHHFTALEPGRVDLVCAYSLLHLVDDRRAALAQIFELLRPGGTFVSSNVCLGRRRWLYAPMLWTMQRLGKAPPVALFSAPELLDEMRSAGFVDLEQPDVGARSEVAFVVARRPG